MRVKRAVAMKMCVEMIADDDVVATWDYAVPGIADGNNCPVDTQPTLDIGSLLTPPPLENVEEPVEEHVEEPLEEPVKEPVNEVKPVDSEKPLEKGNSGKEAMKTEELPANYESDGPAAKKQRIDS